MDPESVMAREERSEAMKPDLQRLREYAAALEAVPIPSVSDDGVDHCLLRLVSRVEEAANRATDWCDEQEGVA